MQRQILKRVLLIFIILFSSNLDAKCSKDQINHINNYLSSFNDLTATFTEWNSSNKSNNGKFFMKRPSYMKLEYNRPSMELLYNRGKISIYDRELETYKEQKIHNFILRAILEGKIENGNLKCNSVNEDDEEIIVHAVAKYDITHSSNLIISFKKIAKTKLSLSSIENNDKNEYSNIIFNDISYNFVPNSIFKINK